MDLERMNPKQYRTITWEEDQNLVALSDSLAEIVWPEFMLHDPIADRLWNFLNDFFPEYQYAVINDTTGETIGRGNSIPIFFDKALEQLPEKGWDWALETGVKNRKAGIEPNLLCAIQIMIPAKFRGRHLSSLMIAAMRDIAKQAGLAKLVAPIRPSLKTKYPLTTMNEYITWLSPEGLPFDPWIRAHVRLGAKISHVCEHSMEIPGSVEDWKRWAKLEFPQSGEYVIEGALNPITIDKENDSGVYIEPNVWLIHDVT